MMKVRTKFNSGLDRKNYMDGMFQEFLTVYENFEGKQWVRPVNLELLRDIKEYEEKYIYFQRVTTIIAAFLKKFEGMENVFHNFLKIKSSAKKQMTMLMLAKKIIKNVRFDEKYEDSIRYTIKGVSKRIDYLLALVNSAYIEMTPLDNYKKKLEAEGKSFFDEIVYEFPLDENVGLSDDNELIQNYIQKVLSSYSDSEDWKEGYEKYCDFVKRKCQLIEESKTAEKLQTKKERQEMAMKKLMNESVQITRKYDDAMITMGYNPGINHIHKEVYRLKSEGKERNKIVLLAKTLKGYDAAVYYYSATTKEPLAKTMVHCSVLGEFEELPEELKKKVDSCDLAMVEVILE